MKKFNYNFFRNLERHGVKKMICIQISGTQKCNDSKNAECFLKNARNQVLFYRYIDKKEKDIFGEEIWMKLSRVA